MSGSAGAPRIKSRADFAQFLSSYQKLIKKFPGFESIQPSGSYNSNPNKQDFGDIDLITHIASDQDKHTVKKQLEQFFLSQPDSVIVPFESARYRGRRALNTGEIITVRYHDKKLGYSAQIDNIVALDSAEANFKQQFLDMPAEKQGLILGLVKVATIETDPALLFRKLNIKNPGKLDRDQEYEFNLSSIELQLRKTSYEPGTFKQKDREVLWSSRNFDDVKKLLYQYNLDAGFEDLLDQVKTSIKNPRSAGRITGVFSSMITVKSGEVGTAKGAGKEQALAKIKQALGETVQLSEAAEGKTYNMKATIFLGSLKSKQSDSNSAALAKMVQKQLLERGFREVNIFNLRNLDYEPGVDIKTESGEADGMTEALAQVLSSDCVIIATPIWWGVHSSIVQAFMERMCYYDDFAIKTAISPIYGKTFGAIISGSDDGFQQITGLLMNLPPTWDSPFRLMP